MGDYIRWAPPTSRAPRTAPERAVPALNRNKRSIRIDLKTDAGREVLLRLVREPTCCWSRSAPACSTASASATSAEAGEPRLVYCAITGYGQDGPNRDAPATT